MGNKLFYIKPLFKQFLLVLVILFNGYKGLAQEEVIPEKPNPRRLFNDYAGLVDASAAANIEQKLVDFYKKSSTQIATVVVNDLGGYDASEYTFKLGEKWGVGVKGKNNGVVFLICTSPKKIFIASGYGTEEFLTDALCKRIIEKIVKPEFKAQNYEKGINDGVDAIVAVLEGKFVNDEKSTSGKGSYWIIIVIFIVLIIIIKLSKKSGPGNGFGGGLNDGGWSTFSSGGFSSWGSSSGGSDGGGFGDFGGGSFGGGGAGGDW